MALDLKACLLEHINYAECRKPVVVSNHILQLSNFYEKILTLLKLDSDCSQASACLEPRLEERREA